MSIEIEIDYNLPFSIEEKDENTKMMLLWLENRITDLEFQDWIRKDLIYHY